MARSNSARFRLSLAAVLFGLCALCMTSGASASVVDRCVVVRHADQVAFSANPLVTAHLVTAHLVTAHLGHMSQLHMVRALSRASAPAPLFKAACIVSPDLAEAILVRENVLALGGAPRAPGPSRAPPTA
jgi:hypothetical protein